MAEHGEDQILDPPVPNNWDQVRSVDKARLVQKLGRISNKNSKSVLSTLV
jgi:mRNA-degrading endonuclease toxin of MazEF toxin-antitoxin module